MTSKRVELHYGGQVYQLPEGQADALDGEHDTTGSVKLNLGDDKWLTIILGPGIPAAISESTRGTVRSIR